jgi:hypothetical protein
MRALPLFALLCACDPAPSAVPDPPHQRAEAIGTAPVQGTLRGKPFLTKTARLLRITDPGRQRIDVLLSASDAPGCTAIDRHAPMVWLRIGGDPSRPGERGIDPESTDWSVHYQLHEDNRWRSTSRARALVRLDRVERDAITGVLSACFGDGHNGGSASCVAGAFDARLCRDPLDPSFRDSLAFGSASSDHR